MPLVSVPPVRYRCAIWREHGPFLLMADQHGRVTTYSCLTSALERSDMPEARFTPS